MARRPTFGQKSSMRSLALVSLLLGAFAHSCLIQPRTSSTHSGLVAPEGKVAGKVFTLDTFELEASGTGSSWGADHEKTTAGTTASAERIKGGAVTKQTALRFWGHVGKPGQPWPWANLALNLRPNYDPVDVTAIKAVRFWVKGDGRKYRLSLTRDEVKDFAYHGFEFTASDEWTFVEVPIESMTQPTWGKAVPAVFKDSRQISFAPTVTDSDFDLMVDDIEFVVDGKRPFPYDIVPFMEPVEELPLDELKQKKIAYTPVPIAPFANRGFRDDRAGDGKGGWTDQGPNSVYDFPTGAQAFQGVPFQISADVGKQVLVLRGKNDRSLPTRASVHVGARGAAVYFLHANAWGDLPNGSYEVRYADGSSQKVALRNNLEIFDFWSPSDSSFARTAWTGKNPVKERVGLTLFAWKNPKPGVEIEEIIAATPGDGAYLMLAGVTVASAGPYLPTAPALHFDDDTWFPYDGIEIAARRGTALDASRRLDAPAGKHGVLTRQGENLVFADGKKARFWGMSITAEDGAPTKERADFTAELVAQLGFNVVRHHLMDAHWSNPGIFGKDYKDTQHLDAGWLERFDYFNAELQKRGIYHVIDLMAQRKPLAGDGVKEPDKVENGYKLVGSYDDHLIELQEKFARALLGHRNKFTGKTYAEDPAVIMVSMVNESSLFFLGDWGMGEIKSQYHRTLLKQKFNDWLRKKYSDRSALERAWAPSSGEQGKLGLAAAEDQGSGTVQPIMDFSDRTREYQRFSRVRARDNWTFLYDTEHAYHLRMAKAIRGSGSKALLIGTNHWMDQPIHYYENSLFDVVESHVYWAHPPNGYQYKAGVTFERDPAIKSTKGIVPSVVSRRVAGSPHVIGEWSSCHPGFRNDALVMMAAYAGFQNMNPIMYSMGTIDEAAQRGAKLDNVFTLSNQGGILSLWPALSTMVHRGDVSEAPVAAYRALSEDAVFDPATRVGLPDGLALVVKSGMDFGSKNATNFEQLLAKYVKGKTAISVTGELFTDWGEGIFRLDTPRTQAISGAGRGRKHQTTNVSATLKNEYVTVVVTSLDDQQIAVSKRLLVSAVGNAVNQGMTLATSGVTWKNAGKAPIMLEPMVGTLELKGLKDPAKFTVYYLSISGKRLGKVAVEQHGDDLVFALEPKYKALHYEAVRE